MIYGILYVLHFYILPRKVYTGAYCLEEWATDLVTWDATLRTAAILDIIFCLVAIVIALRMIVNEVKRSSSK